jgi:nucleoside-triphosphatase
MKSKAAKILLTGLPGCGKTTAITKIIANLEPQKIAGFYTQEIRENNTRKGFSWNRLPGSAGPRLCREASTPWPDGDGPSGILAHIDIKGQQKVGKYGVDVASFEKSIVPILDIAHTDAELFVIDEIGKMECLSKKFITAIRLLFSSDKSVLATVAKKGKGLISEIKNHTDTKLFNLTTQNRDIIITEISQILKVTKAADSGIKNE